ncbi:hypothetical protein BA939_03290 [Rhizobium sp. S41]|nr:hypothetical protein BA939_03290 [Rhizobium sp. S41]
MPLPEFGERVADAVDKLSVASLEMFPVKESKSPSWRLTVLYGELSKILSDRKVCSFVTGDKRP